MDRNDILVIKKLQELNFSHNSFSIDKILESFRDLLNRDFFIFFFINGRADNPIRSMSDLFDVLIPRVDGERSALNDEGMLLRFLTNPRLQLLSRNYI